MSNKPNYRRAPSLAEFAEQRINEGSISIPMPDDGEPIVVPPAEFWSAETRAIQSKLRSGRTKPADVAKSVLGKDYERFALAVAETVPGMDAGDFFVLYYAEAVKAQQGATPGE